MFSDSVLISVTKAGVSFSGKGETGSTVANYAPSGSADDENVMVYSLFNFKRSLPVDVVNVRHFQSGFDVIGFLKLYNFMQMVVLENFLVDRSVCQRAG